MTADQTEAALRAELEHVEEHLAQLQRTAEELRRRIAERWDAPIDEADLSAAITAAEEQEAFTAVLERRRERLLKQLGEI